MMYVSNAEVRGAVWDIRSKLDWENFFQSCIEREKIGCGVTGCVSVADRDVCVRGWVS